MKCLVLGGRGFLGSHLVARLIVDGHEVISFDRPGPVRQTMLFEKSAKKYVRQIEGDFLSEGDLENAINGVDICFHLISSTIADTSNKNPTFDIESNLLGTVKFLNCAVRNGVKRVVFASSGGTIYGSPKYIPIDELHPTNPFSSYGITKLAIEKYLQLYQLLHGLEYVVLRLANPYGELQQLKGMQGAIAVFLGRVLSNQDIEIWGDGSVVRDYVYVTDAIEPFCLAANMSIKHNDIYNIGSGCGHSINEILDAIQNVTGKSVLRKYKEGRIFDVPANVLDISKARLNLNWNPKIGLNEGIETFYKWAHENRFIS